MSARERTILIADDAPDEAEFYAEYISRQTGVTPQTVPSAEDALERLGHPGIDCLVSDSLKTTDGESLVAVAKDRWPDLPVLLYSGHPRETLPTDVADGYLQKGKNIGGRKGFDALVDAINELTEPGEVTPADSPRNWVTVGTYDWGDEVNTPTVSVLQAVADQTGTDFETLPPLYDTIEPDALDQFLEHSVKMNPDGDIHVQFPIGDYLVRASADGTLELAYRR